MAKGAKVVGSWEFEPANNFQCVHDGFGFWCKPTQPKKLILEHGIVKLSDVVPHQNSPLNQIVDFISDG